MFQDESKVFRNESKEAEKVSKRKFNSGFEGDSSVSEGVFQGDSSVSEGEKIKFPSTNVSYSYSANKCRNKGVKSKGYNPFNCDKNGREKVARTFYKELDGRFRWTEPDSDTSYWDMDATGNTTSIIIECKDRDYSSTAYSDWMLEEHKYKALMDEYRESGRTPYYANTYTDDRMIVWNLKRLDPNELVRKNIKRKKYTVIDQGDKDSKVILLPTEKATLITDIPSEGPDGKINQSYNL